MANTYTLLETITVGAAQAASVTFNSIPQTGYTDLIIKASARSGSGNPTWLYVTFNGSTSTYNNKVLQGSGSAASSSDVSAVARLFTGAMASDAATANTFGNAEIYIPNYTSSNQKSTSSDGVQETNAAATNMGLWAGQWTGTAAITTIEIKPQNLTTFAQYSTFSLYGVSALGTTPTKAPKARGGDIIQTDGTYWYHAFLSSGTFTPATGLSCDYLVVAGGGGGGGYVGHGGGGAGGLRSTVTATGGGGSLESALSLAGGTGYTVTIGAGGAGTTNLGVNGSDSVFSTITSTGGGRGGNDSTVGGTGGSGGGSGFTRTSGGSGTANQGFAGGRGSTNAGGSAAGGGGGGAGAVGTAATDGQAGAGGAGVAISSFASVTGTGVSNFYAGGGGGGKNQTGATNPTPGGSGGGGASGTYGGSGAAQTGVSGTANTGGGGGGGTDSLSTYPGGNGGSGIVIIRYLAA